MYLSNNVFLQAQQHVSNTVYFCTNTKDDSFEIFVLNKEL